jgi:hypothetical protein
MAESGFFPPPQLCNNLLGCEIKGELVPPPRKVRGPDAAHLSPTSSLLLDASARELLLPLLLLTTKFLG